MKGHTKGGEKMELTPENKSHLINEINKQTNNHPLFYLKFCREAKFAQDVCEGNLFGNTAAYFRQREIECGERGQGDRFETILHIKTENITVVDRETGQIVLTAPKGTLSVQFGVDEIIPIVSFVGIPLEEMNITEADETHTSFMLPFTEEEYASMQEKFGEFCAIISGTELERRIRDYCNLNGYDYIFERVQYCTPNRVERMEAFKTGSKERFLYKNADLSYQREYRLVLAIEIPEDHFIRIGKLASAACVESKKLKDMIFTVNYKSVSESNLGAREI